MEISYTHIVSHQSSREGGRIKLAVLHTTEGGGTMQSLGSLFDNEEASSHFGIDQQGRIARYVEDSRKAWTQCYLNPVSLSAEQIGFASTTREAWFKSFHHQLVGAANFVAYAHEEHGVPIRRGIAPAGYVVRSGVVQHKNLGAQGCGHTDCGPGYPIRYVRLMARFLVAHKHHKGSRQAKKLERQVNRIRRHYGVKELGK